MSDGEVKTIIISCLLKDEEEMKQKTKRKPLWVNSVIFVRKERILGS
jgi:hypothetical protein